MKSPSYRTTSIQLEKKISLSREIGFVRKPSNFNRDDKNQENDNSSNSYRFSELFFVSITLKQLVHTISRKCSLSLSLDS